MVSIAQLDNEKQALLYQVDCFKDRLDLTQVNLRLWTSDAVQSLSK